MTSLCIPRVNTSITKSQIYKTLETIDFCILDRIDLIRIKNNKGQEFQRVFIHIKRWNTTDSALFIKERLMSGRDIKVVYDFPWFWKISLTKSKNVM